MTALTPDPIQVPGQRFACVPFVGPTARQKCEKLGMKVRGVFATREEADQHASKLIKLDPCFDIFVMDLYQWCLIPPDPTSVEDVHFQDKELHELIRGHYANQRTAHEYFEERKAAVLRDGLDDHLLEDERMEPPSQTT